MTHPQWSALPRLVAAVTSVLLIVTGCTPGTPIEVEPAATGTLLRDNVGLYPRAIQLAHQTGANAPANGRILASVVTFADGDGLGAIHESTDGGQTFRQVGTVADPASADGKGLCCATLYEVPRRVGGTPAGTLLWAASTGADSRPEGRMALRVWRSTDVGRSWTYLSSCATSPNAGGLWEPEFTVDARGRLVCFFADETEQPTYSQFLARTISQDGGRTWGPKQKVVAAANPGYRPGMPIVRRIADGSWLMTYEICGLPGAFNCTVFLRRSRNGDSWGEVTALGTRIVANTGRYFSHTPVLAVNPDGRLLLSGQLLQEPDGSIATGRGNGTTLMINAADGNGSWYEFDAPVAVPNAFDNFCPNYSSPLVPLAGQRVLEIATDRDEVDCRPYYATADVPQQYPVNDSVLGSADGQFAFSDFWTYGTGCGDGCFGGDDHFTNVAGATVRLRFFGTRVTLYGALDPGHGIAQVRIDGRRPTDVDFYAPTRQGRQAVYTSPQLRKGSHTITMTVTRRKNPASANTFVTVDRAVIR